MINIELIQRANLITEKNINDFSEFIFDAHSWYKHLSLIKGGEFTFFIDPLPAEEYAKEQRFHYSWKNKEEYLKRFGYLSYLWRPASSDNWECDYKLSDLTKSLLPIFSPYNVKLYPYMSYEFREAYEIHKEAFGEIKTKDNLLNKDLLIKWGKYYHNSESKWNTLTLEEKDCILELEDNGFLLDNISSDAKDYLVNSKNENEILKILRETQKKIIESNIKIMLDKIKNR